jgi:hypothetical protein
MQIKGCLVFVLSEPSKPWKLRNRSEQAANTRSWNFGIAMKSLYPAEHKITLLTQPAIALKISRHSHCAICSCPHLRPASGVQVFLDDAQPPKQVDQPLKYLDSCDCGHDVPSHGADVSKVGEKEYARRSRVAVRLDEILQVCTRSSVSCSGLLISSLRCGVSYSRDLIH